MNIFEFSPFDLQMFADGGEGGTAAAGDGESSDVLSEGKETSGATQESNNNASTAGEQEEKPEKSREEVFRELIRGEYKDLYQAQIEKTIGKRLKNTQAAADRYNALLPSLQMLGEKYKVDINDTDAFSRAVEDDDGVYEAEALKQGKQVEEIKEAEKFRRRYENLRREVDAKQEREKTERLYNTWMSDGEKLKEIYPSFNIEAELADERFAALLRTPGIDMRTAYEVVHHDEILPAAMQFAAKKAEEKVANSVAANRGRPAENGAGETAGIISKVSVAQLTRQQREDLAKRAARGERIEL